MKRYYFPLYINQADFGKQAAFNHNWGSLLHGAMMEHVPSELAQELHRPALKGYSQYVLSPNDCRQLKRKFSTQTLPFLSWFDNEDNQPDGVWSLSVLDDDLLPVFQPLLPTTETRQLEIKQKQCNITIGSSTVQPLQFEDSFERITAKNFLQKKAHRQFRMDFLTPTTFKQSGQHVLFPSEHLILQNLIMRWDTFSKRTTLNDAEIFAQILANIRIRSYNLFSKGFSANGIWITGFCGYITLNIQGPETLANLVNMLMQMADFVGVGVKTAMGMGAISVTPIKTGKRFQHFKED